MQFPQDSVLLDGSASTDDIGIVKYTWDLTAGDPNAVTMQGQYSRRLLAENLQPGMYTFTLTVSDGVGQIDKDDVDVIVEGVNTILACFFVVFLCLTFSSVIRHL